MSGDPTPRRNDATDHHHRAQRGTAHHHRLGGPRHGRVHPHGRISPSPAANPGPPTDNRALEHGLRIAKLAPLADQLARARLATANYATNLSAAKADGYQLLTRMIPNMGWHFHNPTIQGFDLTNPPILVYQHHRHRWQLAALEWVFPHQPEVPLLPGATYGSFAAACHYRDGSFTFARVQELCATHSPQTGARFSLWHPNLVTLHLWLWYPNPAGLYNDTNPYIQPFNHG